MFELPGGERFEPGGSDPGYRRQRVRVVGLDVLERIVAAATLADEGDSAAAGQEAARIKAYASSELSRRIDAYAMAVAEVEVARRYSGTTVRRMPHNNPGYDLRATAGGRIIRYVEVKGTAGGRGSFFVSEGERQFSERNEARFSLCVVRSIDLENRTHLISWHDGVIGIDEFNLRVRQWQGRVPAP